jgi:hypothetical protein
LFSNPKMELRYTDYLGSIFILAKELTVKGEGAGK